MAGINLKLDGHRELAKRLRSIGDARMILRIERLAVAAGGRIIRDSVKREIGSAGLDFTGKLYDSIKVRTKTYRRAVPVGIIGAVLTEAPHAHMVEFGTAERFHLPSYNVGRGAVGRFNRKVANALGVTKSTGRMPAFGFFRRAWEKSNNDALEAMAAAVERGLDRLVTSAGGN